MLKRFFFLVLCLVSLPTFASGQQSPPSQQQQNVPIPTMKTYALNTLSRDGASLVLRMRNITNDYINIHSGKTDQIIVRGGVVPNTEGRQVTTDEAFTLSDQPISESAFSVSSNGVLNYTRTSANNQKTYLDIEIPESVSILVSVNDEVMLKGRIQEPTALFRSTLVKGSKNVIGTRFRALIAGSETKERDPKDFRKPTP